MSNPLSWITAEDIQALKAEMQREGKPFAGA